MRLRLLSLLLLPLLGLSCALAATRDELFKKADADREAGRHAAAVEGYTAVLQSSPRDGHTLIRRGVSLNSLGRRVEAALDYTRAHAIWVLTGEAKRSRALALTNRADACRLNGDLAGAFADAFSASKVDETYAMAFVAIAEAWYDAGSLQEAQAYLAKARAIDASLSRTFTAEGASRNAVGKTRPDDKAATDGEFTEAGAAYNRKDYAGALAIYDRILARKPLNSGAWGNRGNALNALERFDEAVLSQSHAAAISSSMGGKPESVARHFTNRLNSWLRLGDTDFAVVDGEVATQAHPDSAWVWDRFSAAWYAWGDLAQASAAAQAARTRDPKLEETGFAEEGALLNRTQRLARAGDPAALAELVALAAKARIGTFQSNPARTTAIDLLNRRLERTPRDFDLLILRAEAENAPSSGLRFGTNEAAIGWVDKALALNPDHPGALLRRGLLRIGLLEPGDGIEAAGYADLDRAIALGAKDPEAFSRRATHRMGKNNLIGAIDDLTAALALRPDDVDLLRSRAQAFEKAKSWPDALADRTRLIALKEGGGPYGERAEVHVATQNWTQAFEDFGAALRLEPKDPDHYLGRARAYRLQGRLAEARADHARARELDPLLPALAADLSNAESIEALRNDFSHAVKRTARAFNELSSATADMMKAERESNRAEQRLRRLFDGDDRTPEAIVAEVADSEKAGVADAEDYRDLGRALGMLDKTAEALAVLEKSIALEPKAAATFNLRGRIHESKKDYELAFADYDQAVTLEPKDPDYHRDRGDIWWERSDFEKALADYEAAVAHGAKDAANWFKRGNARLALRRYDEAIADYDKALQLKPDLAAATRNRALAVTRKAAQ